MKREILVMVLALMIGLVSMEFVALILGPAVDLPVRQGPGGVSGAVATGIGLGILSSVIARKVVRS